MQKNKNILIDASKCHQMPDGRRDAKRLPCCVGMSVTASSCLDVGTVAVKISGRSAGGQIF